MGIMKKLAKSGMFGLTGIAASKKGMLNKIARNGGLGLAGMMLAKKRRQEDLRPQISGGPVADDSTGMRGRPMMNEVMVAEETPAMRRGGKVKKMASGGSASKRADGCAIKGKTKGKMV